MPAKPRGQRIRPLYHEPEAVLYARHKAGLTITEAVDRLPSIRSKGTLSEIENGTRSASPKLLAEMARAYNCPLVVLERKIHPAEGVSA
jgi:transcriptional regulator with XRE-family HTH domain